MGGNVCAGFVVEACQEPSFMSIFGDNGSGGGGEGEQLVPVDAQLGRGGGGILLGIGGRRGQLVGGRLGLRGLGAGTAAAARVRWPNETKVKFR